MTMTVGDVLERAWGEIETRGHCKNALMNRAGSLCAMGAIQVALYGIESLSLAAWIPNLNQKEREQAQMLNREAFRILAKFQPEGYKPKVTGYNNHVDTTIDDIREWFAKAIANAGVTV